jgi:central glycolytic genes regulator
MRRILDIQKQLMPDVTEALKKRYTILHHIMAAGIVGRRTLAAYMGVTERVLRAETDFLKEQGLLQVDPMGMRISDTGKLLLEELEPIIKELLGLTELEAALKERFGLQKVLVVPGDSDASPHVKSELGRAAAIALKKAVNKDDVIAVTGGSTMAKVADSLISLSLSKGNLFVPARGGLGESVELQANTIASNMAKRTGGQYRLLHVPDHLSEDAYLSLIQEPNIQEVVEVIRRSRIVIHGIGDAIVMAKRRKVDDTTIHSLVNEGALAEAFGYYFDRGGKVVHKMLTLGLRLEDIQVTEVVIAVAGGQSKSEAISAVMKYGHEDVLVTDEAAAKGILKIG